MTGSALPKHIWIGEGEVSSVVYQSEIGMLRLMDEVSHDFSSKDFARPNVYTSFQCGSVF